MRRQQTIWIAICALFVLLSACGRQASRVLRQGLLPTYDFPLYLTDSGSGGDSDGAIYKYERDGTRTTFVSGLNNPQGIATDLYGQIYVVEQGESRLLRYSASDASAVTVVAEDLKEPVLVAIDSLNEIYVTQDANNTIYRANTETEIASFASAPTALTVGVDDLLIVGLLGANRVQWGTHAGATSISAASPVNVSIDGTGRVYVAEGSTNSSGDNGRVLRYSPRSPGTATVVANGVKTPQGIAVDAVGNIFIVEKGAQRISLATFDMDFYEWATGLIDPQYLAFTKY